MELDYDSLCRIVLKDGYRLLKSDRASFLSAKDNMAPGAASSFDATYEGRYDSEIEGPTLFFSRQKGGREINFELRSNHIRYVLQLSPKQNL